MMDNDGVVMLHLQNYVKTLQVLPGSRDTTLHPPQLRLLTDCDCNARLSSDYDHDHSL